MSDALVATAMGSSSQPPRDQRELRPFDVPPIERERLPGAHVVRGDVGPEAELGRSTRRTVESDVGVGVVAARRDPAPTELGAAATLNAVEHPCPFPGLYPIGSAGPSTSGRQRQLLLDRLGHVAAVSGEERWPAVAP